MPNDAPALMMMTVGQFAEVARLSQLSPSVLLKCALSRQEYVVPGDTQRSADLCQSRQRYVPMTVEVVQDGALG